MKKTLTYLPDRRMQTYHSNKDQNLLSEKSDVGGHCNKAKIAFVNIKLI